VIDPPRCGDSLLVCVDGPSGAGKTQLAAALARTLGDPPVIRMDELYPGWDGLAAGVARLRAEVVAPLTAGRAARYRRWDWARDTYGEHRDLGTPPLLVVEGVGAGTAPGLLIWVDAPEEERYRRAMARDGAAYAPHWARWAAQERAHFAADRTRERADVRLRTG
jgi:chloramphenicol 3-O-phosphotransferase